MDADELLQANGEAIYIAVGLLKFSGSLQATPVVFASISASIRHCNHTLLAHQNRLGRFHFLQRKAPAKVAKKIEKMPGSRTGLK